MNQEENQSMIPVLDATLETEKAWQMEANAERNLFLWNKQSD